MGHGLSGYPYTETDTTQFCCLENIPNKFTNMNFSKNGVPNFFHNKQKKNFTKTES